VKPDVIRTRSFVHDAVRFITDCAREAIEAHGCFRISLSGDKTARQVYQALALADCAWSKWIVTFGDEHCVPPEEAESNFRMASESFLIVSTPGEVLRMKGELVPEEAADEYNSALQNLAERFHQQRLRHDLVLLELGEDGHIASLYPGTQALGETRRDAVCNFVPKLEAWRITTTFPLINTAERVVFLVNDKAKEPLVEAVLKGGSGLPAEAVKPASGDLLWFIGS
jgi:6-phosphogluconolactonase